MGTENTSALGRAFLPRGSAVHIPVGLSSAFIAVHWPSQLTPNPQVTFLASFVSRSQHVAI